MNELETDCSPEINELAAALAKAQAAMHGASKDAANPFFKTSYADIAACWDAWRPAGPPNGLAIIQKPRTVDNKVQVKTLLIHASGQWISETLVLPVAKFDAQGIGSAITYARRYGMMSMIGIAPEDDDGNAATNASHKADQLDKSKETPAKTPPAPSKNGKPDDKRAQVAATLMAAINVATTKEEIAAVGKTAPKGWFNIKDEHAKAVAETAEQRKVFIASDMIDAVCTELGFDQFKLDMLAQSLNINAHEMTSAQAEQLIAALNKEKDNAVPV